MLLLYRGPCRWCGLRGLRGCIVSLMGGISYQLTLNRASESHEGTKSWELRKMWMRPHSNGRITRRLSKFTLTVCVLDIHRHSAFQPHLTSASLSQQRHPIRSSEEVPLPRVCVWYGGRVRGTIFLRTTRTHTVTFHFACLPENVLTHTQPSPSPRERGNRVVIRKNSK